MSDAAGKTTLGGLALIALATLAGLALRWSLAGSPLWHDELWTLALIREGGLERPLDAFSLFHDNNHILHTAWVTVCGEAAPERVLRGLSLLSGLMAIAFGVLLCRRSGAAAGVFGGLWLSLATPMLSASTQARGYAPMLACALAALWLLERSLSLSRRGGRASGLRFGLGAALALFAHFTAIHVISGAFLRILGFPAEGDLEDREDDSDEEDEEDASGEDAAEAPGLWDRRWELFVIPSLAALVVALVYIPRLTIGGGPERSAALALSEGLSAAALGFELAAPWVYVVAGLTLGLAALGLWACPEERPFGVLALTAAVASPALVILIFQPTFLSGRYVLAGTTLILLLLARLSGRLWRRSRRGRMMLSLTWILVLGSHLGADARLLAAGHGSYPEVVAAIVREQPEGAVTLGCIEASAVTFADAYYRPRMPALERFFYFVEDRNGKQAGWWLQLGWDGVPPARGLEVGGARFRLFGVYGAGSTGGALYLYKRASP